MGWFGLGKRKNEIREDVFETGGDISDIAGVAPDTTAEAAPVWEVDAGVAEESIKAEARVAAMPESPWDNGVDAEPLETSSAQSPGYLARLKMAASDSFETAKRAPATFDEAVAVLRGERDVKPDFERATSTVSAAFAGGCIHGWMRSASLAARYPRHQRGIVRVRSGAGKGLSFAMFALIFEGSSAALEALRQKQDMWGGVVGGGLAGMAYGVSGGVASARRGLFNGVWLGGLFGMFRNHVASLREEARLAAEDDRMAQEEKDERGKTSLRKSIKGLEAQLETWPAAQESTAEQEPTPPRRD